MTQKDARIQFQNIIVALFSLFRKIIGSLKGNLNHE